MRPHHARLAGLGALCWLLCSPAAIAMQIHDLDPGQVALAATPFGDNELGDAVGIAAVAGFDDPQAVLFTQAGGTSLLPLLPGDEAGTAFDISEGGLAVGESIDVTLSQPGFWTVTPHAVIWQGGLPTSVESMIPGGSGYELRQAVAINEAGQVVVQGRDPADPGLHVFLFEDGGLTPLGHLSPSLTSSEAYDMNERGQVVGNSYSLDGFRVAFLWEDGVMSSLHDPAQIPGTVSSAHAVNAAGVVVGEADFTPDFGQFTTATVWDHGSVTNLGSLELNAQSLAMDINDHGSVVGFSQTSFGDRAFIREGSDPMQDLNDRLAPGSGWTLLSAQCITNDGRIFGEGVVAGDNRPYVLVPECAGGFAVFASASVGSDDFVPGLWGQGCPVAGEDVSIAITNGVGGEPGLLLFGGGTGVVPFKPGLDLAILPLLPLSLLLGLDGTGPGAGTWQLTTTWPAGVPSGQLTLQTILADPGTPSGFSVTNALSVDIP